MRASCRGRRLSASLIVLLGLTVLATQGCGCAIGEPMRHDAGPDSGTADAGRDAGGYDAGQVPPTCGNGRIDEGEACDPQFIGAGDDLICECDDGNPCTTDRCQAGTSVDDCSCLCEHIDNSNTYGIGTCNDGMACTNDVVACADPLDPRTPVECEATCEISCNHVTLPQCVPGCGNGVADPGETCENPIIGQPAPGLPPCTCEDSNPCTLDTGTGDPATCTLVCTHLDRSQIGGNAGNWMTGYGYGHCDDHLTCTADSGGAGPRSNVTCQLPCQHDLIPGWAAEACDDDNACTNDSYSMEDPNSCSVQCSHTMQTGYGTRDPGGCTAGSGTCTGTGFTTCNDSDVCTADTVTSAGGVCPMTCSHRSIRDDADMPDDSFADTNCDGVDGNAARLVFVAKTGNNAPGCGTRANPCLTVQQGLNVAVNLQLIAHYDVAVSKGTYDEIVTLANGISIYGGYDATANWARSSSNLSMIKSSVVQVGGFIESVVANGLTEPMVLDHLTITTEDAPANVAGVSVYGMRVTNSAFTGAGLVFNYVVLATGAASPGAPGSNGAVGQTGSIGGTSGDANGAGGGVANCGSGDENVTRGGSGGAGGSDPDCGACTRQDNVRYGDTGGAPPGAPSCTGGVGGRGALGCVDDGAQNGTGGSSGCGTDASTRIGAAGTAVTSRGSIVAGRFTNGNATGGSRGGHGVGGAGGGGGGAGDADTVERGARGGGGGGGGAGGCGGYAGTGATSGGSAFAFLVSSSSNIEAINSSFYAGPAGAGGKGGDGGGGGNGQMGGGGYAAGHGENCDDCAWWCTGAGVGGFSSRAGAGGGTGRAGGSGGGGGGGAGGSSVGRLLCGASNIRWSGGVNAGGGGAGAAGGGGLPNGPSGAAGLSTGLLSSCNL